MIKILSGKYPFDDDMFDKLKGIFRKVNYYPTDDGISSFQIFPFKTQPELCVSIAEDYVCWIDDFESSNNGDSHHFDNLSIKTENDLFRFIKIAIDNYKTKQIEMYKEWYETNLEICNGDKKEAEDLTNNLMDKNWVNEIVKGK